MTTEPHLEDDGSEVISFEAIINGKTVCIRVDREAIEDHLQRETTTADERLRFVIQNRNKLVKNAARYLGAASDIDGILLTADQLA